MEPVDLLTRHGIDPGGLEAAPAPPARRETLARVQAAPPRACVVCGGQAATARAVSFPGAGSRWVDLCWEHGMAVRRRSRLPASLEGIAADLRAAAREASLPGADRLAFYSSFEAAASGCRDEDPE
ncbi:hypothetical protein ACJ7VE_34230 [Streptomyces sp. PB17]|uniref:hypothetical protein n=1 Tax=Streptomyces sp. PB17 TaxID=3384158 RepID=UPI0038B45C30